MSRKSCKCGSPLFPCEGITCSISEGAARQCMVAGREAGLVDYGDVDTMQSLHHIGLITLRGKNQHCRWALSLVHQHRGL